MLVSKRCIVVLLVISVGYYLVAFLAFTTKWELGIQSRTIIKAPSEAISLQSQIRILPVATQEPTDHRQSPTETEPEETHLRIDSESSKLPTTNHAPKTVYCFGDSLTAGYAPPGKDLYPYAKDLQIALGPLAPTGSPSASVWSTGLVAWTAQDMGTKANFETYLVEKQNDRQRTIDDNKNDNDISLNDELPPPFDLVVVLAGTNDLKYSANSDDIFQSIKPLHDMIRKLGTPTIALGIPPIGLLPRWWPIHLEPTLSLIRDVNEKLRSWAESTDNPKTTFVHFPIQTVDQSSGLWNPDEMHLSKSGYELVGKSLAPIVAKILWEDNNGNGDGETLE